MKFAKLELRPAGMFSNVNEVIQQLYLAERQGYRFVIDWSSCCYKSPQRETDPWNYYFEDCFVDLNIRGESLDRLTGGVPIACSRDNIITPRLIEGVCDPLLLPRNRELPHRFIKNNIQLKPTLRNHISELESALFSRNTLGLHIRGPGRSHGGAPALRSRYKCKNGVPFERYYKFVDEYLLDHPEANIFTCSDSNFVIKETIRRYGERVVLYPATRSDFGEMHVAGHPENRGLNFSKYKLGEDVISEAYLLSHTDYFIHGNSNVANFVLCKNPYLPNRYVYDD